MLGIYIPDPDQTNFVFGVQFYNKFKMLNCVRQSSACGEIHSGTVIRSFCLLVPVLPEVSSMMFNSSKFLGPIENNKWIDHGTGI